MRNLSKEKMTTIWWVLQNRSTCADTQARVLSFQRISSVCAKGPTDQWAIIAFSVFFSAPLTPSLSLCVPRMAHNKVNIYIVWPSGINYKIKWIKTLIELVVEFVHLAFFSSLNLHLQDCIQFETPLNGESQTNESNMTEDFEHLK